MDKCEVQSDCFVIRESKIKCAYPRGREIAFSILNTTLHPPQKHFPGLKTAIPCPGGNLRWSFGSARAAPSGNSQNYSPLPQQGKQGIATGKGSSHSMESKALRPARARPTAWKARHCDRQRLVPQHGKQGIAAGKGSSRSRKSKSLPPAKAPTAAWRARHCGRQRLVPQHGEQGAATGTGLVPQQEEHGIVAAKANPAA